MAATAQILLGSSAFLSSMTKGDAPLDVPPVSELDAGLELCVIGRVH